MKAVHPAALCAPLLLASCMIAPVRGLGPPLPPATREVTGQVTGQVTVAGGGSADGAIVQTHLRGGYRLADWATAELGLSVGGDSDPANTELRSRQALTMPWGLWPTLGLSLNLGPVDVRLVGFLLGGGGPQGPGGLMALAGGTVGARLRRATVYAGYLFQWTYGLLGEREYSSWCHQVPVGFAFPPIALDRRGLVGLRPGVEALYVLQTVDQYPTDSVYDRVAVLLTVSVGPNVSGRGLRHRPPPSVSGARP